MRYTIINLVSIFSLMLLVTHANAEGEIYKWKDANGIVRYSDTAPADQKNVTMVRKKPVKTVSSASANVGDQAQAATAQPAQTPVETKVAPTPDELAAQRRNLAETEKRNNAEKKSQADQKKLNCASAQANLRSFKQGGRVFKTNEKGEREYYDDKQIKDNTVKAQKDVNQYCN